MCSVELELNPDLTPEISTGNTPEISTGWPMKSENMAIFGHFSHDIQISKKNMPDISGGNKNKKFRKVETKDVHFAPRTNP